MPKKYRRSFTSHFALVLFLAEPDNEKFITTTSTFNWLAWEFQNQRRGKVMFRLYQKMTRLRTIEVREAMLDGKF